MFMLVCGQQCEQGYLQDGLRRGAVVPAGPRLPHASAGLGAAAHGADQEVDDPEDQERPRVLYPAAPDGCHGGETGGHPAWWRPGLHQPAK